MKKRILIGFFITIATGHAILCGQVRLITCRCAVPSEAPSPQLAFMGVGSLHDTPQDALPVEARSSDNLALWWIFPAVLLLAMPLYLLFLIRRKQLLSTGIERLQKEILILFHRAPCGYHEVDEAGVFTNINNTLLDWLGYEKDDVVGKLHFADIVSDQKGNEAEKLDSLLTGKASGGVQLHLRTKAGASLAVVVREVPTADLKGAAGKRLFSTIDNSECDEALERIKNLDHELESFSYSISHDLRAPLRSIDGYSRILQEDYAAQLGDEGRRVLNVVMNNARRMGTLIDNLLEFGRLGRKSIQRSYVDTTAMVNVIVHELLAKEVDRRVDVAVGDLHIAFADADMIRQVWYNLLDNAIKYTNKRDVATLTVRSYTIDDNTQICYEVKDNGVGFDMKYASKLFGVFQRLHKIQDFIGTGVGLAIVKRIVSRHGGRVWGEGSPGNGATFYFTIPVENDDT